MTIPKFIEVLVAPMAAPRSKPKASRAASAKKRAVAWNKRLLAKHRTPNGRVLRRFTGEYSAGGESMSHTRRRVLRLRDRWQHQQDNIVRWSTTRQGSKPSKRPRPRIAKLKRAFHAVERLQQQIARLERMVGQGGRSKSARPFSLPFDSATRLFATDSPFLSWRPTMALAERLAEHIRACFTGLWIESHEHDDAIAEISQLCRQENWHLAVWDIDRGLRVAAQEAGRRLVPCRSVGGTALAIGIVIDGRGGASRAG